MLTTNKLCVDICMRKISTCEEEAKDTCQKHWMLSLSTVCERKHFGVPNFSRDMKRIPHYIA